jgi:putative peptidoglycan lipid II flippase
VATNAEADQLDTGAVRPSLARSTAVMTIGTIISRATGVIRLAVLAATFGVAETRFTDAYNLANTFPNIVYELVLGGVITSVFVPVFVELIEKESRERAAARISAIFNLSLLVLGFVAVIGVIAAPWIARFYASRLTGEDLVQQQEVLAFLLRLFIPQVVLYGVYFITSAALNANGRFALPMYTPILNNLVLIAVLIVFQRMYGLVDLESVTTGQLLLIGLGTSASVAPMGLLLLPAFRRLGGYRFTLAVDRELLLRVGGLSIFVIGYVATNQLGYLVLQWLANAEQGGYTAYIAANTFFLLPIGLFVWSITTALAPSLSRSAIAERWTDFTAELSLGVRATLFLILPSTVGFLVLRRPLVEAMLEHGVVTARSVELVTGVLTFLVLGLVQFSIFLVLVRAFYALQDARTPFWINAATIGLNVAINVPMYAWLGVKGLAAGQAAAYTAGVGLQLRALRRRTGDLGLQRIARTLLRAGAASAGMGAVVWVAARVIDLAGPQGLAMQAVALLVATGLGIASYLGLALLLKVEEIVFLRKLVGDRFGSP